MDGTTFGFSEDVKMGYRSKTGEGYILNYIEEMKHTSVSKTQA